MDEDQVDMRGSAQGRGGVRLDKLLIGIAFLLVGAILTVRVVGGVRIGSILTWWPLLLVAVGLAKLVQPGTPTSRAWGAFLVLFFGIWLAHNLELVEAHPVQYWPLALVFFGGTLVWRAVVRDREREAAGLAGGSTLPPAEPPAVAPLPGEAGPLAGEGAEPPDTVAVAPRAVGAGSTSSFFSAIAFLGGTRHRSVSDDFRGGDATAVMGGCNIDLRDARIAQGLAVIETFAWWGGIEIKVPPEWAVVVEGTAILGAYEDKTRNRTVVPGQTLVVRGVVIMGGVEISS